MKIKSWGSYKNWINNGLNSKTNFLYRGQKEPEWKLSTSYHRKYAPDGQRGLSHYLNGALVQAQRELSVYDDEIISIANDEEKLAFMSRLQHHGFPTPMLDWTESPYIAAYFAYREVDANEDGKVVIYIFDYGAWIARSFGRDFLLADSRDYVHLHLSGGLRNQRFTLQQGAMTVTNVEDLQSFLMTAGGDDKCDYLYRVELPRMERSIVMTDLNLMGINAKTLFPGLDGVCEFLKEKQFGK